MSVLGYERVRTAGEAKDMSKPLLTHSKLWKNVPHHQRPFNLMFILHRVPFPLLVELKLYVESVSEELHWPHTECIMFLSVELQWYLKGPRLLYWNTVVCWMRGPINNDLKCEAAIYEKQNSKKQNNSILFMYLVMMTLGSGCFLGGYFWMFKTFEIFLFPVSILFCKSENSCWTEKKNKQPIKKLKKKKSHR